MAEGDLRDRASLAQALRGCSMLFHVAADYRFDVRDPEEMWRSNVEGTRNLLEEAGQKGVARIVYTSTVGCIGLPASGALGTESTPVRIEDMPGPYKRTKFQAEEAVKEMAGQGLPVVIVNPTAPVGERDVKPTPTGAMIIRFLHGKMPVVIDTGLNLIDVRDCAQGHLLAAERGRTGERYILGCRNLTLMEICRSLARIANRPPPRGQIPWTFAFLAAWFDTRISQIRGKEPKISLEGVRMGKKRMFVDGSKAIQELALPQTPPEDALARAVHWFKENRYA
jgi:dihydroflavonol-4-reductase